MTLRDGRTMIRVIYRWTVDPAEQERFCDAWRAATERIRREEPGAMGSTLLRPVDDHETWVGLARWRSRQDIEAFWARGETTPLPGATFLSAEILDEWAHLTIEEPDASPPDETPSGPLPAKDRP